MDAAAKAATMTDTMAVMMAAKIETMATVTMALVAMDTAAMAMAVAVAVVVVVMVAVVVAVAAMGTIVAMVSYVLS